MPGEPVDMRALFVPNSLGMVYCWKQRAREEDLTLLAARYFSSLVFNAWARVLMFLFNSVLTWFNKVQVNNQRDTALTK